MELKGDAAYQRWIDSGGSLPFPGGESRESFAARCANAFNSLNPGEDCAIIAHGGTLMAIMEKVTQGNYFDFQVKNGEGYKLYADGRYELLFEKMIDTQQPADYNESDK